MSPNYWIMLFFSGKLRKHSLLASHPVVLWISSLYARLGTVEMRDFLTVEITIMHESLVCKETLVPYQWKAVIRRKSQWKANKVYCNSLSMHELMGTGACFSKVPRFFGRISGDIILFISSKLRCLEARNFAVIFIFIPFTTIIWKDQLYRISWSEFYEWFFWPEKFSGLSRNRPLVPQNVGGGLAQIWGTAGRFPWWAHEREPGLPAATN